MKNVLTSVTVVTLHLDWQSIFNANKLFYFVEIQTWPCHRTFV